MKLFGGPFAIPTEKIQTAIQAAVHDETHKGVQHLIDLSSHLKRQNKTNLFKEHSDQQALV